MMGRKHWLAPIFLVALMIFPKAVFPSDKVRFAIHAETNPLYQVPMMAALEKGSFQQQGLEVNYVPFRTSPLLHQSVTAGTVDMGVVGLISLTQAVARGAAGKAVADPGIADEWVLLVLPTSPIRRPQDLKGTRISVSRVGSSGYTIAQVVARHLGLEKDVRIVATGGGAARIAILKTGAVDVTVDPFMTAAPLIASGQLRLLLNASDYGLPRGVVTTIIFAHRDFLKKSPDIVRRGITAFMLGTDFVTKNREWAVKSMMISPSLSFTREGAELVYPRLRYAPEARKVDTSDIQRVISWLLEYGLLRRSEVPAVKDISPPDFSP